MKSRERKQSVSVLIIDDSALMRKVLGNMVQEIDQFQLMDVARNGRDALKILERIKPDIITLDVEMPVMNGIQTLKEIKARYDIPVIMLSSQSNEEITIRALELGALDFIEKPVNIKENWDVFKKDLEQRIIVHFTESKAIEQKKNKEDQRKTKKTLIAKHVKAVVIGASTGGPKALLSIIRSLPKNMRIPVFIVQHMPPGFTTSFAKRLNTAALVDVAEARDREKIKNGTVYVAPGGKHMTIAGDRIQLDERPKNHGVRPAVDYLFETAAIQYREHLLGIILTGMGTDGTEGCRFLKAAGGYVVAQDKQSSVVYGMPRSVAEKGYSDDISPLLTIGEIMKEVVRES